MDAPVCCGLRKWRRLNFHTSRAATHLTEVGVRHNLAPGPRSRVCAPCCTVHADWVGRFQMLQAVSHGDKVWRELAQMGKIMARLAFDVMWLVPAAACLCARQFPEGRAERMAPNFCSGGIPKKPIIVLNHLAASPCCFLPESASDGAPKKTIRSRILFAKSSPVTVMSNRNNNSSLRPLCRFLPLHPAKNTTSRLALRHPDHISSSPKR